MKNRVLASIYAVVCSGKGDFFVYLGGRIVQTVISLAACKKARTFLEQLIVDSKTDS